MVRSIIMALGRHAGLSATRSRAHARKRHVCATHGISSISFLKPNDGRGHQIKGVKMASRPLLVLTLLAAVISGAQARPTGCGRKLLSLPPYSSRLVLTHSGVDTLPPTLQGPTCYLDSQSHLAQLAMWPQGPYEPTTAQANLFATEPPSSAPNPATHVRRVSRFRDNSPRSTVLRI